MLKKHNHFVSEGLLKNWSQDGKKIYVYRILVSHENVPVWEKKSIEYEAYHENLYTTIEDGQESDSFEDWIWREFETPGISSLDKLIGGQQLSHLDWSNIIRFVALQDVRTPTMYQQMMKEWRKKMPSFLDETLQSSVAALEAGNVNDISNSETEKGQFQDLFRIKKHDLENQDPGKIGISVEIDLGRKFWLRQQKHLLTGVAKQLLNHKWSVVTPASGYQWPISDHPVLKLNYYKNGNHDFGGGWGRKGTEIIMPVSPQHLLYTRIGSKEESRMEFSTEITQKIIGFLIERSYRRIYALNPLKHICRLKPRIVNAQQYKLEESQWSDWHRVQSQVEYYGTSKSS